MIGLPDDNDIRDRTRAVSVLRTGQSQIRPVRLLGQIVLGNRLPGLRLYGPASFHLHDAIEAWNKRVTEPTPADDLAASVAGVADIPARREEDDLNKLDEA